MTVEKKITERTQERRQFIYGFAAIGVYIVAFIALALVLDLPSKVHGPAIMALAFLNYAGMTAAFMFGMWLAPEPSLPEGDR